jgi:hypothetical protein
MRTQHSMLLALIGASLCSLVACDRSDINSHSGSVNEGSHLGASAPPAYEGSGDPRGPAQERAIGGGPGPDASAYVHPTTAPQRYRNEAPLGDPDAHQTRTPPAGAQRQRSGTPGASSDESDEHVEGAGPRHADSNGGLGATSGGDAGRTR